MSCVEQQVRIVMRRQDYKKDDEMTLRCGVDVSIVTLSSCFLETLAFKHVHDKKLWHHVYMTADSPSRLSFLCPEGGDDSFTSQQEPLTVCVLEDHESAGLLFFCNYTQAKRSHLFHTSARRASAQLHPRELPFCADQLTDAHCSTCRWLLIKSRLKCSQWIHPWLSLKPPASSRPHRNSFIPYSQGRVRVHIGCHYSIKV